MGGFLGEIPGVVHRKNCLRLRIRLGSFDFSKFCLGRKLSELTVTGAYFLYGSLLGAESQTC